METVCVKLRAETTLEKFLRTQYPLLPENILQRALRQKDIKRDGKRLYPNTPVRFGDELSVYIDGMYLHPPLPVAFDDGELLILIKPRGIPSVGEGSLEEEVQKSLPAARACHRLDTKTGGLIVFSLTDSAHERMLAAFHDRRILKTYRATVLGCPSPSSNTIHAFLRKDALAGRVDIFDVPVRDSLPIETSYQTLYNDGETSELSIGLVTGRTHQIRAQLAHIGHPVLGDDRYGNRDANKRLSIRSLRLWASALDFDDVHVRSAPPWEENDNEAQHSGKNDHLRNPSDFYSR